MRDSRFFLLLPAMALVCALSAYAQDDAPSLGDVARQARQQKLKENPNKPVTDSAPANPENNSAPAKDVESSQDAQSKDTQSAGGTATVSSPSVSLANQPPAKHVITNDEIPSHIASTSTAPARHSLNANNEPPPADNDKISAADWVAQIKAQKGRIDSLKRDIETLGASIQYTGGNCVSGCVEWNERQKQKQDQVDSMKSQLEQEQQRLEEMQEQARQQGYGSSVYDQ